MALVKACSSPHSELMALRVSVLHHVMCFFPLCFQVYYNQLEWQGTRFSFLMALKGYVL